MLLQKGDMEDVLIEKYLKKWLEAWEKGIFRTIPKEESNPSSNTKWQDDAEVFREQSESSLSGK